MGARSGARRRAPRIREDRATEAGRNSTLHPVTTALAPSCAATSPRGIAKIVAAVGTNESARLRVTSTASAGRPKSCRYAHPVARTRVSPIHSTRSTFPEVQGPRIHVMSFGIEGSTAVKGVQSTAGRGDTYVNRHGSGYCRTSTVRGQPVAMERSSAFTVACHRRSGPYAPILKRCSDIVTLRTTNATTKALRIPRAVAQGASTTIQ